jgi:hypothetical protein
MSNSEKCGGENPARWHRKTAMVWVNTLRDFNAVEIDILITKMT